MRLNKYELITEIAMLCDELEAYKRSAESIKRDIEALANAGSDDGLNANDLMCLKVGRAKVFEDCTSTWYRHVHADRNEDTGEIEVTSFKKYCESTFVHAPESMSKNEFMAYFEDNFREAYEEEKAKAIAELEESEVSVGE